MIQEKIGRMSRNCIKRPEPKENMNYISHISYRFCMNEELFNCNDLYHKFRAIHLTSRSVFTHWKLLIYSIFR